MRFCQAELSKTCELEIEKVKAAKANSLLTNASNVVLSSAFNGSNRILDKPVMMAGTEFSDPRSTITVECKIASKRVKIKFAAQGVK